ncbi:MAG: SDR family oxidoreductase [Parachlamydia sp.]|jgi:NAD(P)-dependent dehydrogenase (short-subunit alcohol dehydrogenase family)|nr:SDR family oxidoreductase [Parachlamydia sp.]
MQKVYAIFGATGGIGSVLTKRLSETGEIIYLLGRSEEKLERFSKEVSQPYMVVDATDENLVAQALKKIVEKEGHLDGVVSLVGSFYLKPLHLTTQKEFEEVMKVNTTSSFCILKHALSIMEKGSIVLSSSTAGLIGLTNHEAIAAAKAAVIGLMRSAAASYATKGIRINAVAPGLTRTPLTQAITNNEIALKASTAFHPLGRIGEPEDVAAAILWLLSDESAFVTADVIAVDGGLSSIKLRPSA